MMVTILTVAHVRRNHNLAIWALDQSLRFSRGHFVLSAAAFGMSSFLVPLLRLGLKGSKWGPLLETKNEAQMVSPATAMEKHEKSQGSAWQQVSAGISKKNPPHASSMTRWWGGGKAAAGEKKNDAPLNRWI